MALIPPHYLDAVAALEELQPTEDGGEWAAIATATLVGFKTGHSDDEGKPLYFTFLVTNKHVIERKTELYARFNKGNRSERFRIAVVDDDGKPEFIESNDFASRRAGLVLLIPRCLK
jgi:hypothetical protein